MTKNKICKYGVGDDGKHRINPMEHLKSNEECKKFIFIELEGYPFTAIFPCKKEPISSLALPTQIIIAAKMHTD